MDGKGKPALPDLATELVEDIARELDNEDLSALHSVNRSLYEKTQFTFAKRHFTHVHIFLHPVSFDKLHRLVNDAFYAQHIEHITISTYVLRERDDRRKGSSEYTPLFNQFHWDQLTLGQASSPSNRKRLFLSNLQTKQL